MLLVHNTTYKTSLCGRRKQYLHAAGARCCYVATTVTFNLSHTPLTGGQLATGICAVLVTGLQERAREKSQQEPPAKRSTLCWGVVSMTHNPPLLSAAGTLVGWRQ